MNSFDELLQVMHNMPFEVDAFNAIPEDRDLAALSPIDEINSNLEPFSNLLKIGHLNAVSLPKYRDEIFRTINKTNFDIICISETNVKKNTPKDLYQMEGYKFFQANRENRNSGGVGVFVKNTFSNKVKKIDVNYKEKQPEIIFLEIEVNNIKLIVGVLYKSPCIRYGVFSDIFEYLAYFCTKYEHVLFLGDLNIDLSKANSPAAKFLFEDIINPLSLTQIINTPTRITDTSSTLIDLIMVNNANYVKFSGNTCISGNLDHSMVYCAYSLRKPKFKPITVTRRDFRKFAEDKFKQDMQNVNWSSFNNIADQNLEQLTQLLEDTFTKVININAPFREIRVTKPLNASWMTDEITFMMDLRDKYRKSYTDIKRKNLLINMTLNPLEKFFYNRFKELKNQVNHLIRKAKINDFNEKLNSKVMDSKKFHSALKKFNVVSSKRNPNSKCYSNPDRLNQCFVQNNNAKIDEKLINDMINKIGCSTKQCNFHFKPVTPQDIHNVAKTLKSNACGIDEISAFFIKLSINSSAGIFAEIVNASLKSGYFPSRWKKARIKPIPKIDNPIKASDYRPISLLITFSKMLEKIVAIQMKAYFIENNLLDPFQSAYKEKHSTNTALIDITYNIYKAMDNSEITVLVLLDYSKAFDCANHKLILAKLKHLGFSDLPLQWIKSYLSNRSQQVLTELGESKWVELANGVPQGSILGPLLFTILVSDISKNILNCKYHLYADDTQLYISGKPADIEYLINLLNQDLTRIAEFSTNNCLKLNEGKSVYIIIGSKKNIAKLNKVKISPLKINNKIIIRERVVKNLGVLFDENLSWKPEINNTISKGYGKLKQAYRHKNFLSIISKKCVVQSYLLSQFNYNSIILQNLTQTLNNKIQKFQNTCVRFILNLKKFDHISDSFNSLGILNMENSRTLQALSLMHKIVNKRAPLYLSDNIRFSENVHNYGTRSRRNIYTEKFKTNFGKYCFFNKIGKLYNNLTSQLSLGHELSDTTFKLKIKKIFSRATR